MNDVPLREESGWDGAFTRRQAEGAVPNGTAIVKVRSERGDAHRDGTPGVVLGSFRDADQLIYFVEWAPRPRVAVGCMSWKIEEAKG